MKNKGNNLFWVSYADLMTSLFFIMLVLYVLTFVMLKKKEKQLQTKVEDLDRKLKVFSLVEENLKPLKQDTALFQYEGKYKRFKLAFDVEFEVSKNGLNPTDLKNYSKTIDKINEAGSKLNQTINYLAEEKQNNPNLKNVSYLVIISGYASHLASGTQEHDYELSYQRAYNLWDYWKKTGINFEANKYKGLIDLQISGNGWGGVGRYIRDPENRFENEVKNQRFIIQVVPKIGDTSN